MARPKTKPEALSRLAIKAEATRYFELLSDDAEINISELALVDGTTENAIRQSIFHGRLEYPVIRRKGKRGVTLRVGDIRRVKRERAALAAAQYQHQPVAA